MNERYVAFAIPFFFLAIALEVLLSGRKRAERYRFGDSIASLSCGVGQQILAPFFKTATLALYVLLYDRARVYTFAPSSVLAWVVLLFGVDCGYYWFHRASHRINVIWAGHIVHHQSEEYNLSVALRQSWFVKLAESFFYLPLALAGFSPEMFLAMSTLNTLYQFWIHTRAVGKLGPLEWIFNTPSHHRVHHGINPKYIDKNYAGIFIIWDRLFGTFQEEEEEPVYGIVKPLASYNPVWANVHYFVEIARLSKRCPRLFDRVRAWWMPPDWRPRELGGNVVIPDASRATQSKYDPRASRGVEIYVAINFLVVAAATATFLWFQAEMPFAWIAAIAAVFVATLVSWGALLERKRWALPLEAVRVAAAIACAAWLVVGKGAVA
jgi:sterol desaturase/sphingolipid hydroxylase (fatty acid hydroxylase superfamily)